MSEAAQADPLTLEQKLEIAQRAVAAIQGKLQETEDSKLVWVQNVHTKQCEPVPFGLWRTSLSSPNMEGRVRLLSPEEAVEQERRVAQAAEEREERKIRRGQLLSDDPVRDVADLKARLAELESQKRDKK